MEKTKVKLKKYWFKKNKWKRNCYTKDSYFYTACDVVVEFIWENMYENLHEDDEACKSPVVVIHSIVVVVVLYDNYYCYIWT